MRKLTDPVEPPRVALRDTPLAVHQRRAVRILKDGFRSAGRLYLVLLAIEASNDGRDGDAKAYRAMLHSFGFMGSPEASLDVALKTQGLYAIERSESNVTGFVIGKYTQPEHNYHVDHLTWNDNGIIVRVIAQDHGKAQVNMEINFPDSIQSRLWPSRLCDTHAAAYEYAGQVITLAQFLMTYRDV